MTEGNIMRRKVRVPAESEKELGRAARQKKPAVAKVGTVVGRALTYELTPFRFSTGGDSYGVIPVL